MTHSLRIIFAGTPDFAVPALRALHQSDHEICAVYTQPDRPAGRGQHLAASPVKQFAFAHQLSVYQPSSLKEEAVQKTLRSFHADVMIVAAYGLILPKAVLQLFPLGCMNIHSSLLPRWRGAAPIHRALLAGDHTTGVTIMQMAEGLDTGDILLQMSCPIEATDTSQTLHDRLAMMGADAMMQTFSLLKHHLLTPIPQDETQACYAGKLKKEEANLDWNKPAAVLERAVRAYQPWPVAYSFLEETMVRIWQAESVPETTTAAPGCILQSDKNGILVATSEGCLRLRMLQLPGGRPLPVGELLNAKRELFKPQKCFHL